MGCGTQTRRASGMFDICVKGEVYSAGPRVRMRKLTFVKHGKELQAGWVKPLSMRPQRHKRLDLADF